METQYAVVDMGLTDTSGADLPHSLFEGLASINSGLIIILPDGIISLCAELVQSIADMADGDSRIELILYKYYATEITPEFAEILCHGDEVFNVQLLVDGEALTYIEGRLAIAVIYDGSPYPGVWRVGDYGDFYPQEFIFDDEESLVTFFPERSQTSSWGTPRKPGR